MRNIGSFALGAVVMLICRVGLHMAFWPSIVAVVLASVVYTTLGDAS